MRKFPLAFGAAITAALFACSKPEAIKPCPRPGILGIAADMDIKRPGGTDDITDLAFTAEMVAVELTCVHKEDFVDNIVSITMAAERGPAGRTGSPIVSYFVAIVEKASQRILDKRVFTGVIPIAPDERRGVAVEEWGQTIVLPGKDRVGRDYEVLVGFNLSPEQLDKARRQRGD